MCHHQNNGFTKGDFYHMIPKLISILSNKYNSLKGIFLLILCQFYSSDDTSISRQVNSHHKINKLRFCYLLADSLCKHTG